MTDHPWIDPRTGRESCPARDGFGYHEDGTEEGELCVVCDGRGVATTDHAERLARGGRAMTATCASSSITNRSGFGRSL